MRYSLFYRCGWINKMLGCKHFLGYGFALITFFGCAAHHPALDTYEQTYLKEYESIKSHYQYDAPTYKWIQPNNKKESCKIYVGLDSSSDKTLWPDYALYWDGDCKEGFAYGLGREIETSEYDVIEQIGFYEQGRAKEYCAFNDLSSGMSEEGECVYENDKAAYLTTTRVQEQEGDFEVLLDSGVGMSATTPAMFSRVYIFHNIVEYWKMYPNFSYVIVDYTGNASDERAYEFYMQDHQSGQKNGYAFVSYKSGETVSREMVQGKPNQDVTLWDGYYKKVEGIVDEIRRHATKAMQAQKKAVALKTEYLRKICNDDVNVDFMDNDDYKAICAREYELGAKVNAKLSQMKER